MIKFYLKHFLESSTIHGLVYISTESKFARFFWVLVVISGLTILFYCVIFFLIRTFIIKARWTTIEMINPTRSKKKGPPKSCSFKVVQSLLSSGKTTFSSLLLRYSCFMRAKVCLIQAETRPVSML